MVLRRLRSQPQVLICRAQVTSVNSRLIRKVSCGLLRYGRRPRDPTSVHPGSVTPSLLLLEERPAAHTLHIGRAAVRPLLVWTVLRVTGADASPGLLHTSRAARTIVDIRCVRPFLCAGLRFLASPTQSPLSLGFLAQVQNCQPEVLNIRSS